MKWVNNNFTGMMSLNYFKNVLLILLLCLSMLKGIGQVNNKLEVIAYYAGGLSRLDSCDVRQLTQIIFSFGHLNGNQFHIRSARDTAVIQKMVDLKKINPTLKVLLSLGGWGGCETCSDVFSSAKNRKQFSKSFKKINEYFTTDGIDLDWEYPAVKGFPGHKFSPDDRKHFTKLVRRLRKTLGSQYELSFAAGISQKLLDSAIDWKKVMKKVDRVNLMTYDLAGGGTPYTAHHTHLYSTPQQQISADYAVEYLTKLGVPANKLVIGAAFYGKIWEGLPGSNAGLYQPAKFKNTIAYKNLVSELTEQNGFSNYWDDIAKAPFLCNLTQNLFVSYDNKRSIQLKTEYAINKKLNGIMFWQLASDAYTDGLLPTINEVKKNYKQ